MKVKTTTFILISWSILTLKDCRATDFWTFHKKLTKTNGLPSNCIYDIQFDKSKNNLFIASDRGLCKFDGHHYKYFLNHDTHLLLRIDFF